MKTRMTLVGGRILLLLTAGVALFHRLPGFAQEAPQRAAREVEAFCRDSSLPSYELAVAALSDDDPERRQEAGRYLHALVELLWTEEQRGLPHRRQLFDDYADFEKRYELRSLRREIAAKFGETAQGEPALEAAAALLTHEPDSDAEEAAFQVVARTETPHADKMILHLLAHPEEHPKLVPSAIAEALSRTLPVQPALRELAGSYDDKTRRAARQAAAELKLENMPAYVPAKAFTPELQKMLRDFAAMAPEKIPAGAPWVRVTQREPSWRKNQSVSFSGWLLSRQKGEWTVLDYYGRKALAVAGKFPDGRRLPEVDEVLSYCSIAPRTFAEDARLFAKIRADPKRFGRNGELFPGYTLRQYFESAHAESITKPEALLAAWCFERGRKDLCASLLFPRLQFCKRPWLSCAVANLLGTVIDVRMVSAFCAHEDAEALRLARHLAQPCFREFEYQGRAPDLAAQIVANEAAPRKLQLPTAEAWVSIKATLDRSSQMRFLADRLYLLRCEREEAYETLHYSDPQFAEIRQEGGGKREIGPVINPYVELRQMRLSPSEVSILIPYLADETFTRTYDIRDSSEQPNPGLHRVNQVIARIINVAAHRDFVELAKFDIMSQQERGKHLAKLQAWALAQAGQSTEAIALEALQAAQDWRDFQRIAAEAVYEGLSGVVPVLAGQLQTAGYDREAILEMCAELPGPSLQAMAAEWSKSDSEDLRFWGTVARLRHGSAAEQDEAVQKMAAILKVDSVKRLRQAFTALLKSPREPAQQLAIEIAIAHFQFGRMSDEDDMLLRLFLHGRAEAFQFLIEGMESPVVLWEAKLASKKGGKIHKCHFKVGDAIGWFFCRWTPLSDYQWHGTDAEQKAARQKVTKWLREQFALIQAGGKTTIKESNPERLPEWKKGAL